MVVHGGVDGFSRAVVFLRCSNNSEAITVLEQFLLAPESFTFHAVSEQITEQKTWKLQDTCCGNTT
jgi:hypothetical protein